MTDDRIHPDPLTMIGNELVLAARRRSLARRRRARGLTGVALVAGLLAITGGALAVGGVSTGVPAIDRLLDVASDRPHEGRPLPDGTAPPEPDFLPDGTAMSPPLEVATGGGERAIAIGYRTRDGAICSALADPDAPSERPRGGVGCAGGPLLARELARSPARTMGGGGFSGTGGEDPMTILQGFTRDDVLSLAVLAPGGRVEADLSEPWTPADWRGGTIRVFYAVLPLDPSRLREVALPLEAKLPDGTTVQIAP